ncbi:MAG: YbaK/EbsC family protein [Candidatus Magasanikbacteria bacterium]
MNSSVEPYNQIKELFHEKGVDYQELNHEPVITSQEAERVRGESVPEGVKSLLIKVGNDYKLIVIPSSKKFSYQKLRNFFETGEIKLADPQKVEDIMNCSIGGCYPIGQIVNLETYLEETLADRDKISFNAGRKDKTMVVDWENFKRVASFELIDMIK